MIPQEAFGLTGTPTSLPGGQGTSVRVGDVVLKPVVDVVEATWCAEVFDQLAEEGFRVGRPVQALDGRWVVDGWVAAHYLSGTDAAPDWPTVRAAGRAFHAALAAVPRPDFLDQRTHLWAVADRVAWGRTTVEVRSDLAPILGELLARMEPLEVEEQLIHGDLAGNVLTGEPPGILDFSPYWHCVDYADAQVVVDALLWHDAPWLLSAGVEQQLLLRALVFRVVAFDARTRMNPGTSEEPPPFEHVLGLLST